MIKTYNNPIQIRNERDMSATLLIVGIMLEVLGREIKQHMTIKGT